MQPIYLEDEDGQMSQEEAIFGLFHRKHGFKSRHGIMINPYVLKIDLPIAFVVFSKENKIEMLALQRLDAFYFSNVKTERGYEQTWQYI